jgi:hypothetical protein
MKYPLIIFQLILVVFLASCASGQNPYFNNKNTLGLLGGAGGGVLGNKLCKGCNNTTKLISTIGGVIGGMWLGSTAGEYFDRKDQDRQVKLIEDVLANNRDNETSTTQYTKTFRNPNGQQKTAVISQSATPLNTTQPNRNVYLQNDIQPLRRNNGVGNSLYASNNSLCRDLEITISISADGAPPTKQQYYKYCKTEQGWKSVN